jgi:hypothetical protein
MKLRPTSVTVISWILIVLGAMSLVVTALMFNNPAGDGLGAAQPSPGCSSICNDVRGVAGHDHQRLCDAQGHELGSPSLCHLECHRFCDRVGNFTNENGSDSGVCGVSHFPFLSFPAGG